MYEFDVRSTRREELINIDGRVQNAVESSGITEGICTLFTPHTTAGITINENADPDVPRDMIMELGKIIPHRDPDYRHNEMNSDAHIKSSLVGCSESVFIRNGKLFLGTWQSIFFCEFDGPRTRKVFVRITPS